MEVKGRGLDEKDALVIAYALLVSVKSLFTRVSSELSLVSSELSESLFSTESEFLLG